MFEDAYDTYSSRVRTISQITVEIDNLISIHKKKRHRKIVGMLVKVKKQFISAGRILKTSFLSGDYESYDPELDLALEFYKKEVKHLRNLAAMRGRGLKILDGGPAVSNTPPGSST